MGRIAADGLVLVHEKENEFATIEINSETDFVAKNQDFINFCKELSILNFESKADLQKLNDLKMSNH